MPPALPLLEVTDERGWPAEELKKAQKAVVLATCKVPATSEVTAHQPDPRKASSVDALRPGARDMVSLWTCISVGSG